MTVEMIHTTLAKAEGNGKISFIQAHPDITAQYPTMKSAYLSRYNAGDLITIAVVVSESGRRSVNTHALWREDAATWATAYENVLLAELDQWQQLSGELADADEDPSAYEPIPVDDEPAPMQMNRDSDIYVASRDNRLLDTLRKISGATGIAKVLFVGPSGYGKSTIPMKKAEEWGMSFLRWDCATVRDPEEFFGFRGARGGSTQTDDGDNIFTPSLFTQRLIEGNAVILLDELSRLDPALANVLFPILDDARSINVAGHQIEVGPNVVICASINVGYQYTGTFTLDEALRNRFDVTIEVGPLPHDVEVALCMSRNGVDSKNAEATVRLMAKLRALNEQELLDADASTRVSLALTRLIAAGLAPHEAIFYTVISGLEREQRTNVINAAGVEFEVSFDD